MCVRDFDHEYIVCTDVIIILKGCDAVSESPVHLLSRLVSSNYATQMTDHYNIILGL